MTDWAAVHQRVLDTFAAGWDRPGPHAWDSFLALDVELVQPMLRDGRGPELWWDEVERLTTLLPELRADVLAWSGVEATMFIEIRFSATLGGKPLTWRAVDVLTRRCRFAAAFAGARGLDRSRRRGRRRGRGE